MPWVSGRVPLILRLRIHVWVEWVFSVPGGIKVTGGFNSKLLSPNIFDFQYQYQYFDNIDVDFDIVF